MAEGAPGVYSTDVVLYEQGPLWARFSVNASEVGVSVVRVVADGSSADDVDAEVPYTVAAVIPTMPATMQLGLFDTAGASVGLDGSGAAITWPQAMTQVPGRQDSWYYADVTFSEGGRIQVVLDPPAGPSYNDVIVVNGLPAVGVLAHFGGWEPNAGLIFDRWASLSYIRKWIGWTQAHVGDEDLRELRRTAVETFIFETNSWWPAWDGTWHALRGQGSKLYLPVPLLLPQDGGVDPVVEYHQLEGDQESIDELDNDDLAWYVRGFHSKQPYVEHISQSWDHTIGVRITGTWGAVGPDRTLPIKVRQLIVGLIRWHGLSFGVDGDDSRDQATLFRIESEGTRDARATYAVEAIGKGLTGDRTIDRALAELTIQPGPWIRRGGSLPVDVGRHGGVY
jgi:hypothetical protein